MTFLFTETYIEKGQKRSKTGHKYHLFMSFARFRLCLEDFVSEGDKSWGVGPFTTKYVLFSKNIHKRVKKVKKVKKVTNGIFYVFARFRLCLEDCVAEDDKITGRRPVHYERRTEDPSL